jgi:hypothetical protein
VSRLDRKRGRFSTNLETAEIFEGIEGWQQNFGDWIDYYQVDEANSQYSDVFEEAIGTGLAFKPVIQIPCIHVQHIRGGNERDDRGFYYNDTLMATVSFKQYTHCGMLLADIDTGDYMKDWIVYDQKVFAVTEIAIRGQIQRRDTIVAIDASQVKPDELLASAQFAKYANSPAP